MAINSFARWSLIRDVTCNRKSGTLVLQMGQRYVSWSFVDGNLTWIHSTAQEYTLTQFLLQNQLLDARLLDRVGHKITDATSLGALLMKEGIAGTGTIQEWTARHAESLCPLLVQSTVHLFWADRLLPVKQDFVHHAGIPLPRILLSCDRSLVEVRTAFQFMEEMPAAYRALDVDSLHDSLQGSERRLVPYLRRAEPLRKMLADPELDRLTCCRALFLLWIAGRLNPVSTSIPQQAEGAPTWMDRARAIPPDWIIPLVVGVLLGVLLRPAPDPPPPSPTALHQQSLPSPAWHSPAPNRENNDE